MTRSKNRTIPCEFEAFWRPFIRIFQALCVSSYLVFRPNLHDNFRKSWPYLMYFLSLASLHISLVVLTTSGGLHSETNETEQQPKKFKENHLMFYVNSLSVFGSIITHTTIHMEALFGTKQEQRIYEKLRAIDDVLVNKLNSTIDYKTRRAKYIRNVFGTFALTVVLASTSTLATIPNLKTGIEIHFMKPIQIIAIIIIRSRWCYIALLINVIADTLNDLQSLMKQQQQRNFKNSSAESCRHARKTIRYFRDIYSNVWIMVNLLSDSCGWSLITFLIEFTFETMNALYWLYINLHLYGSYNINIRKNQRLFSLFERKKFHFRSNFFAFTLDIVLYNTSLLIMFCYLCMISENCQNMVRFSLKLISFATEVIKKMYSF